MKTKRTYLLSQELLDQLDKLSISRSSVLQRAFVLVSHEPRILAEALNSRLSEPKTGSSPKVPVSASVDHDLEEVLEDLCEQSRLTLGQVVHLSVEAYLKRLARKSNSERNRQQDSP